MVVFAHCHGRIPMGLRRTAAFCIALAAMAASVQGDSISDFQTFQNVVDSCGKTSNWTYSKAQYAEAQAAANREIARLGKKDSSFAGRIAEIRVAKKRLKDCEKEESAKFPMPPFTDCKTFLKDAKSFMFWAAKAKLDNSATASDIDRSRQKLKPRADYCVREVMKNCIDPQNTKTVLDAVDAVETASKFTDIYSYSSQTGLERTATRTNPFFLTLRFCTDTDFACKGDPSICSSRVPAIKAAFQSYVER